MIYVDSSVVLARLFAEARSPPDHFWAQPLIASRLLQYEVWNRIHARRLGPQYRSNARELLALIDLIELEARVLGRALEPFPTPVRTLDGLHLASLMSLRAAGEDVKLASYDSRLATAARAIGIPVAAL